MTPQEIREQQQLVVDQKLRAKREERLNDAGDLAIIPAGEVTLGQFNYHGDALRRLDPIKYSLIQRNLLIHLIKNELVEGHDYGLIPGCGDKPALKKPGAERIADFFGYSISVDCTSKFEDYDKGLFAYTYKATVRRKDGSFVECEANCNSKEKKYGQRKINKRYATEKEKQSAINESSYTDGKSGKTTYYIHVPNDDIFSIVNTIMKMSEKRAIVGAVLLASNASGFFENAEQMTPREIPENRPTWDGDTIDAEIVPDQPVQPAAPLKKANGTITPAQITRMMAIAQKAGYAEPAIKAIVAQAGFTSRKDIPSGEVYDQICATLGTEDKSLVAQWNQFAGETATDANS